MKFSGLLWGCFLVTGCLYADTTELLVAMNERVAKLESELIYLRQLIEHDDSDMPRKTKQKISRVKQLVRDAEQNLKLEKPDKALGFVNTAIEILHSAKEMLKSKQSSNLAAIELVSQELLYCHYLRGKVYHQKGVVENSHQALEYALSDLEYAKSLHAHAQSDIVHYILYMIGVVYKSMCDRAPDTNPDKYEYLCKACDAWASIDQSREPTSPELARIYDEVNLYLKQFGRLGVHAKRNGCEQSDSKRAKVNSPAQTEVQRNNNGAVLDEGDDNRKVAKASTPESQHSTPCPAEKSRAPTPRQVLLKRKQA